MFGLGTYELLIILAVLLLLFGHQLPTLMRSMGRSVGEFKSGLNEESEPKEKLPNEEVKQGVGEK
jgi:sec-independent protein translocase protein TatA